MPLALDTTGRRTRPLRAATRFGLVDYLALLRQRHALARLDATRLLDLGISGAEARAEAARPFWDVPAHWQR